MSENNENTGNTGNNDQLVNLLQGLSIQIQGIQTSVNNLDARQTQLEQQVNNNIPGVHISQINDGAAPAIVHRTHGSNGPSRMGNNMTDPNLPEILDENLMKEQFLDKLNRACEGRGIDGDEDEEKMDDNFLLEQYRNAMQNRHRHDMIANETRPEPRDASIGLLEWTEPDGKFSNISSIEELREAGSAANSDNIEITPGHDEPQQIETISSKPNPNQGRRARRVNMTSNKN